MRVEHLITVSWSSKMLLNSISKMTKWWKWCYIISLPFDQILHCWLLKCQLWKYRIQIQNLKWWYRCYIILLLSLGHIEWINIIDYRKLLKCKIYNYKIQNIQTKYKFSNDESDATSYHCHLVKPSGGKCWWWISRKTGGQQHCKNISHTVHLQYTMYFHIFIAKYNQRVVSNTTMWYSTLYIYNSCVK